MPKKVKSAGEVLEALSASIESRYEKEKVNGRLASAKLGCYEALLITIMIKHPEVREYIEAGIEII